MSHEDSKSGVLPKQPCPIIVRIIALKPLPGKTPWWTRASNLIYSHIAIGIGDVIWDQPWRGTAAAYNLDEWLLDHKAEDRGYMKVTVELDDHDPFLFLAACKKCEGRRTQRWRSILRYLGLWRKPAWNCTSPVREIINALTFDYDGKGKPVIGETADDIIKVFNIED